MLSAERKKMLLLRKQESKQERKQERKKEKERPGLFIPIKVEDQMQKISTTLSPVLSQVGLNRSVTLTSYTCNSSEWTKS